jgi:enolase
LAGVKKFVLPTPAFNVINGGMHAGNRLDVQEFLVLPSGARCFSEALRIGSEVYQALRGLLLKRYGRGAVNVGDEGGFAPSFSKATAALDVILDAVEEVGYAKKVELGLDCAASSFFKKGFYAFEGKRLSAEKLLVCYERLLSSYPLVSVEDPFFEESFGDFAALNAQWKGKVQVVGDDLTVTSTARIQRAINGAACSCVLIKPNQVGTVSESLDAVRLARAAGLSVMASHRSGETCDSFIADFAVGTAAGQIKAGAPCRGERLAKYNRLLRIEELLGKKARFAGRVV